MGGTQTVYCDKIPTEIELKYIIPHKRTRAMKEGIHPEYKVIKVKLADGSTFETKSTMNVDVHNSDVDSTNHPFYTGKRQFVDTAGRVEKFRRRYGKPAEKKEK